MCYSQIRTMVLNNSCLNLFYLALVGIDLFSETFCSELFSEWIPDSVSRNDLRCPLNACTPDPLRDTWSRHHCCVCNARPTWDINGSFKELSIEYISRDGSANILGENKGHLKLIHSNGFLSKLPLNLCDFDNIVEIDLSFNNLVSIGNISCLKYLDTLDLSYNSIKLVTQDAFVGLELLRVLRMTNNKITNIEPFTLSNNTQSIFMADFSYNKITKIDVSNIIPEHDFCEYSFASNEINELVNIDRFKLDADRIYNGGFIDLNSNLFTEFIDFKKLGTDDIRVLGKVLKFGFSFLNSKWNCDCETEPYLELAEIHLRTMWRNYFNMTCWNPPKFRGYSIPDYFVSNNHLDELICDIPASEKCPKGCTCFRQPKNRRAVVNCTNAGLTKLPLYMPEHDNLTLILTNNSITSIDQREYLNRTFLLDLSNNGVKKISSNAFSNTFVLKLDGNDLTSLPRNLQTFDPCSISIGKVLFKCDCNDLWLREWTKKGISAGCMNKNDIACTTSKGNIILASLLLEEDICDRNENGLGFLNILFIIIFTLVIGGVTVCYKFRYELYLLKRKYLNKKSHKISPVLKYDVFFSFDSNIDFVRMWAIQVLWKYLKNAGYRCYIPCINDAIGGARQEALYESINSCKNYIVIITDSYKSDENELFSIEWKYIWNSFTHNKERNIIIINFDYLKVFQMADAKMAAILRLGHDIKFCNRKHDLYKEVRERLGHPLCSAKMLTNARTMFNRKGLYVYSLPKIEDTKV